MPGATGATRPTSLANGRAPRRRHLLYAPCVAGAYLYRLLALPTLTPLR